MPEEISIERLKIEVAEKVAAEVDDWLRQSDQVSGGLLLGNVYFQEKNNHIIAFVRVEAMLPARHIESSGASLRFSSATWQEWDRLRSSSSYTGMTIIGWVHSYPDEKISFIGQDLNNQKTYFNQPWQIAWVLDPRSGAEEIYGWQQGNMVSIPDWQLVQTINSSTRSSQRKKNPPAWQEKTLFVNPPGEGRQRSDPRTVPLISDTTVATIDDFAASSLSRDTVLPGGGGRSGAAAPGAMGRTRDYLPKSAKGMPSMGDAKKSASPGMFAQGQYDSRPKSVGKVVLISLGLFIATALATFGIYTVFAPK